VALVAAALLVLATLTVEPLRAHLWAARGAACGTVATFAGAAPRVGGTSNEQCLQRAVQRCQAATLTYDQMGVDTDYTITLVSEPAVPYLAPCSIAVLWTNNVDVHFFSAGMEHCARIELQSDGLHVSGCGSLGDFVVPAH
jgi:hypothetical protein